MELAMDRADIEKALGRKKLQVGGGCKGGAL